MARDRFENKPELVHIFDTNRDKTLDELELLVNIDSMFEHFPEVRSFDQDLRYNEETIYHILGGNSIIYDLSVFRKIFPNIPESHIRVV